MRKEDGIDRIMTERYRQVHEEGWDEEHDDEHTEGELALAAGVYAIHTSTDLCDVEAAELVERYWPFDSMYWKPGDETVKGRIRCLEKAGALIAAEIDRLLRLDPAQ